jgi:hypothetical protein
MNALFRLPLLIRSFSILQGWLPIAGDVWSAKQIYVNETQSVCAISKEDNQLTVVGMR